MTATMLPISKLTYAARLDRLKAEKPLQAICNKCGTLSITFYAGCCWLCCHANNPTFGTSDFRRKGQESSESKMEEKLKLETWIGRDVEFRATVSPFSRFERGVVVRVVKGLKGGMHFCVRSHSTGKQCYRRPDQVRIAPEVEEDASVLQQTA